MADQQQLSRARQFLDAVAAQLGGGESLQPGSVDRFNLDASKLSLPKERVGGEVPGEVAGPPFRGEQPRLEAPDVGHPVMSVSPEVQETVGGPPPMQDLNTAESARLPRLRQPAPDSTSVVETPESISLRARPGLETGGPPPVNVEPGRDSGEIRLTGGDYDRERPGSGRVQALKSPRFWMDALDRVATGAAAGENQRSFLGGFAAAGDELAARDEYAANAPYRQAAMEQGLRKGQAETDLAVSKAEYFPLEFEREQKKAEIDGQYKQALTAETAERTRQMAELRGIRERELTREERESAARIAEMNTKRRFQEIINERTANNYYTPQEAAEHAARLFRDVAAGEASMATAQDRASMAYDRAERRRIQEKGVDQRAAGVDKPPSIYDRSRVRLQREKIKTDVASRFNRFGNPGPEVDPETGKLTPYGEALKKALEEFDADVYGAKDAGVPPAGGAAGASGGDDFSTVDNILRRRGLSR